MSKTSRIFLVLGTPGAGKTTVLKGIGGIEVFNIGTEMLNAHSRKLKVTNRDLLKRKVISNYIDTVQIRHGILNGLIKKNGVITIDTHASVKSGNGYIPGMSLDDLKALRGSIRAIIYIDADTKDIMNRRKSDKTRNREGDTAEDLNQHREINIAFTTSYSLHLETPIYIVKNKGNALKKTQAEVSRIIKSF